MTILQYIYLIDGKYSHERFNFYQADTDDLFSEDYEDDFLINDYNYTQNPEDWEIIGSDII